MRVLACVRLESAVCLVRNAACLESYACLESAAEKEELDKGSSVFSQDSSSEHKVVKFSLTCLHSFPDTHFPVFIFLDRTK